jgi:hypothetical protein
MINFTRPAAFCEYNNLAVCRAVLSPAVLARLGVQAVNCASLVYLYRSDGPLIMTLESMTVDAFRGTTLQ